MSSPNVTEISVSYPEAADRHVKMGIGACRLKVAPGEGDSWVTGTYRDPSGSLPCRVTPTGGTVKITVGEQIKDVFGFLSGTPVLDLALGKTSPYSLTLESGACETDLDLGGLPITRLVIQQGAGKNDVDFTAPNPQEMDLLSLSGGAVSMDIRNLANANFAELKLEGGAAAYKLDFGGTLRRDAQVKISTGVSSVEIAVPAGTAAKIISESLLGGLDVGDGFMKKEGAFCTEAAVAGKTPVLTIRTTVALGSLRLRVR